MIGNQQLVPFGKYKGQPIETLQADPGYCEWLMSQDWFRNRYPQITTVIINNFGKPEDTPEHNALQAKFLDNDFTSAFIKYYFKDTSAKNINCEGVDFEVNGWDVVLHMIYEAEVKYDKGNFLTHNKDICIEIKPEVGDDYPSVLRQIKANGARRNRSYDWYDDYGKLKVLLYQGFTASGATEEQVKQIFKSSNCKMISFDEIGE